MRATLSTIILFAVCLAMFSCREQKPKQHDTAVIVSILPQKYLVDKISGGSIVCEVMIPPGGNHETFEPSPRDMARVADASLYFAIGALDFEKAWIEKVRAVNPELLIVNTSTGIDLIKGHSHHESDSGSTDPHTWLSPKAVKMQAAQIYSSLCLSNPRDSSTYHHNLLSFLHEADSADNYISRMLEPYSGKTFLIYHPALAYFARDYGLIQESIEYEGKEPSPVHMREIIDKAKSEGIRTIFVSKEFDTRHAETIAGQLNGSLVVFDPMAYNWTENMMTIAKLISSGMEKSSIKPASKQ